MQFQFLLVRLKVTPRIDYSQGNEISIPFGAIKRLKYKKKPQT